MVNHQREIQYESDENVHHDIERYTESICCAFQTSMTNLLLIHDEFSVCMISVFYRIVTDEHEPSASVQILMVFEFVLQNTFGLKCSDSC